MVPVTVLRTYQPESGPAQAVLGSGLKPGDMIVTEGQLRLTPGARISLLDAPHESLSNTSASLQHDAH
jgi:multidrug efflux system membrane fusion protein